MKSVLKAAFGTACIVFALALLSASPAMAQSGKNLFAAKGCPACHGPGGKKPIMAAYPILAGQNAQYLEVQLKAFKAQQRKSGQSSLMWGMAAQLNDAQIKKIAEYLSKEK